MQPSGLRPEFPAAELEADAPADSPAEVRPLPFQWSLLAWAALVGVLTGLAVVGFHYLIGFINNFLFGPVVEGLMGLFSTAPPPPPPPPAPEPLPAAGTQIGRAHV